MHWLSKSAEELISADAGAAVFDAIVVGSGYGGSVAALRLAQVGQKVCLLERGQEWLAGEFPTDVSQVGKHVRAERSTDGRTEVMGYENALFDFRLGKGMGALVGNGLGGGSLINAGVGLKPHDDILGSDEWPSQLRSEDLQPFYRRASNALGLFKPGTGAARSYDARNTAKYQRLRDLRAPIEAAKAGTDDAHLKVSFEEVPVAVHFGPDTQGRPPRKTCIGCGNCVTGCNHDAKLTLTKTYLPRAGRSKAQIYTGISVLKVTYDPDTDRQFPWIVSYVRTSERQIQHDITAAGRSASRGWVYELRATRVVLAAGTFGTTEILQRSRGDGPHDLALSKQLGRKVSGNGDDIACVTGLQKAADAVGRESSSKDQRNIGPTITAMVRYEDQADQRRSALLQDGSVPGLLTPLFSELIQTLGIFSRLEGWRIPNPGGGDPLAIKAETRSHTLTLLGIGHDEGRGEIRLDDSNDRVTVRWKKNKDQAQKGLSQLHSERVGRAMDRLGGDSLYIQNPARGFLPPQMSAMLQGPKPEAGMFTVHPLGGCRMADSIHLGVCNHRGQVFREIGKRDTEVYEGLYVMDGSILPGSLGVNPLLTITALAERSCALIVEEIAQQTGVPVRALFREKRAVLNSMPKPPAPLDLATATLPQVNLSEVLRGPVTTAMATPAVGPGAKDTKAALFVQMEVDDWTAFFQNPLHRAKIVVAPVAAEKDYAATRLLVQVDPKNKKEDWCLYATDGTVDLYTTRQDGLLRRIDSLARVTLTYWLTRYWPDLGKEPLHEETFRAKVKRWLARLGKFVHSALTEPSTALAPLANVVSGLKSFWHATEVREFRYLIELEDRKDKGARYTLQGLKVIEAAATWKALWERVSGPGMPPVDRLSIWEQLGEVNVRLLDAQGHTLLSGRLGMELPDIVRNLMPKLGVERDTLTALAAFAGYPLLLARGVLKTRILDFRAPDYAKNLPKKDPALEAGRRGFIWGASSKVKAFPPIHDVNGQKVTPITTFFNVKANSRDLDLDPPEVELALVRYRQPALDVKDDKDAPQGVKKVRAIVLINGFALSTLPFAAPGMNGKNLATCLYNEGWDVWMLEFRVSPLLAASARFSTMDDIAQFDIPGAVDVICKTLGGELSLDPRLLRIHAFSHCVGSASLAMSLAEGFLAVEHPDSVKGSPKVLVHRIAGVIFSQFHPYVIGSDSAQQRIQLGSFLHNVLGLDKIDFAAGAVQADVLHAMLDRVFATMREVGQQCPKEKKDLRLQQPDSTTCKRMTGLLSRLYNHDKLDEAVHDNLDTYFGRTNLGVFLHGAKCVHYERLVDYDGRTYMSDDKVRTYLDMPIMLMHGEENRLFSKESLIRSKEQIRRAFGVPQDSTKEPKCTLDPYGRVVACCFPGFAHFDCTVGTDAAVLIFPRIAQFLGDAWHQGLPPSQPQVYSRARLPVTGPMMGWVRPGPDSDVLVRVWAEFDNVYSDRLTAAVTQTRYMLHGREYRHARTWPVQLNALPTRAPVQSGSLSQKASFDVSVMVGDVSIPVAAKDARITVLGIYSFHKSAPKGSTAPPPAQPDPPSSHQDGAVVIEPLGALMPESDVGGPDKPMSGTLKPKGYPAGTMHPKLADLLPPPPEDPNAYPEEWGILLTEDVDKGDIPLRQDGPTITMRTPDWMEASGADISVIEMKLPTSDKPMVSGATRVGDVSGTPRANLEGSSVVVLDLKVEASASSVSDAAPAPSPHVVLPPLPEEATEPLDRTIGQKTAETLISVLERDLADARTQGGRADPDTLSSIKRNWRWIDEAEVCVPDHLLSGAAAISHAFVAAGCRHPGITDFEAQRADHSLLAIGQSLGQIHPSFMAMLGDQVYVDARAGLFDTASPIERIVPRYRQAFGSKGFRAVASKVPLVMVMDDHEINDNWTFEQNYVDRTDGRRARLAKQAFKTYQRSHGADAFPNTPYKDRNNFAFEVGDIAAFVLDSRSNRRMFPARRVISDRAWELLTSWLVLQQAVHGNRPKWVLSGSVVAPGLQDAKGNPAPRDADDWQFSEFDRACLLCFILAKGIQNVVFLSSDYHCSATARITFTDSKVEAFAIIAPPLHAPLRFANSEASTLMPSELVSLPEGLAQIQVQSSRDGEGWLECSLAKHGQASSNAWQLAMTFNLRGLEDASKHSPHIDQFCMP